LIYVNPAAGLRWNGCVDHGTVIPLAITLVLLTAGPIHNRPRFFLVPVISSPLITLRRGADTFDITPALWEAMQLLAVQRGWEPAGTFDGRTGQLYRSYISGCFVRIGDALRYAAALERFVNSERAEDATSDLPATIGVVNFLRGGVFEIVSPVAPSTSALVLRGPGPLVPPQAGYPPQRA
jgi:hypothetical protein